MSQFPQALAELEQRIGAKEFHWIDVFQGRNEFQGVPFDDRMNYFRFMVHIFQQYQFPILVQTVHPEKPYIELFHRGFPQGAGPLSFGSHEDLGLMLLIIRAKWLLRDDIGEQTARLFLDEGRFRAGSTVRIPRLDPPFVNGEIVSATSSSLHPLQLADFAAFAMNRTQLLLGRQSLTLRDECFLELLSPLTDNFKNISRIEGRLHEWPPLSQDDLMAFATKN